MRHESWFENLTPWLLSYVLVSLGVTSSESNWRSSFTKNAGLRRSTDTAVSWCDSKNTIVFASDNLMRTSVRGLQRLLYGVSAEKYMCTFIDPFQYEHLLLDMMCCWCRSHFLHVLSKDTQKRGGSTVSSKSVKNSFGSRIGVPYTISEAEDLMYSLKQVRSPSKSVGSNSGHGVPLLHIKDDLKDLCHLSMSPFDWGW